MSTPAGWYDDGSGRTRWWDGQQWTEHFADKAPAARPSAKRSVPPGAVWSAQGKPLSGIGAGRYHATEDYLIFERGSLSTRSQQIRMREIHDVDMTQSMGQKARGVGTITLMAYRPSGAERVVLEDIPNFREGVTVLNKLSDAARHRETARQNTQHLSYAGVGGPVVPGLPSSSAPDLNAELAKLVQYLNQGILTNEEFTAAKQKLLGI